MNNLPNIDFKKSKKEPTIDADTSEFELPFYKTVDYFASIDNFVGFVKAVEKLVRTSTYYSSYIRYLKNDIGLTFCEVLSNIQEDDDHQGLIEMHHGPILTLFDYASIMTDWFIAHNKKINTFRVADKLLEEHYNNNIQIVMLSKTVHEEVHENNIFINLNQAFGNLNVFLKKYYDGLHPEQIQKINSYIESSKKYDSYDNDVLKLTGVITKWNKDNE